MKKRDKPSSSGLFVRALPTQLQIVARLKAPLRMQGRNSLVGISECFQKNSYKESIPIYFSTRRKAGLASGLPGHCMTKACQ